MTIFDDDGVELRRVLKRCVTSRIDDTRRCSPSSPRIAPPPSPSPSVRPASLGCTPTGRRRARPASSERTGGDHYRRPTGASDEEKTARGQRRDRQARRCRAGGAGSFVLISPLHDEGVAARLGIALGVAFLSCFATGLVSHFAQYPLD